MPTVTEPSYLNALGPILAIGAMEAGRALDARWTKGSVFVTTTSGSGSTCGGVGGGLGSRSSVCMDELTGMGLLMGLGGNLEAGLGATAALR